jgi:multiple sugar transport system ATP-binding protein
VRNPKVFLFDEPLSNLHAKLRVMARGFLKRLQKELEVTTVHVTHDQAEAMTMADRIAVLNNGRLIQMAPPTEIHVEQADLFVAGFIGSPPHEPGGGRDFLRRRFLLRLRFDRAKSAFRRSE